MIIYTVVLYYSSIITVSWQMPEVHFIGSIDSVHHVYADALSVTWAIVPGNEMSVTVETSNTHQETLIGTSRKDHFTEKRISHLSR